MKKQLLSKPYWLRFAYYFLSLIFLYTLVFYLMREKNEAFWTFEKLSSRIGTAYLFALVFSFKKKSETEKSSAGKPIIEKPALEEFFVVYFIIFVLTFVLMTAILFISWVFFHYFSNNTEPFLPTFLKTSATDAVMCLFIAIVFFIKRFWNYKRSKKVSSG